MVTLPTKTWGGSLLSRSGSGANGGMGVAVGKVVAVGTGVAVGAGGGVTVGSGMWVAVGSGRGVNVLRGTSVGNGSGVLGVPEAQAVKTKTNVITAKIALIGFISIDPHSHRYYPTEKTIRPIKA